MTILDDIDHDTFEEHVRTALGHLYDHAFLQDHPLAQTVAMGATAEARGRAIRRLLLDAIQDLKPPQEAPPESPAWHHYQYLYMRYVEAKPVAEIAGGLSVTERQARRRHREALAALSSVLWDRWHALANSDATAGARPAASVPGVSSPRSGVPLDAELQRIGATQASGPVDIVEGIDSALRTVARLAELRDVAVSFARPPTPALAVGDRVILRQVILASLVYAIQHAGAGCVDISTATAGDRLMLRIDASRGEAGVAMAEGDSDGAGLTEIRRLLQTQRGTLEVRSEGGAIAIRAGLQTAQLRTVLIVDDNPDALQLLRRYLGNSYRVVEALSGDEALRLAREIRPDSIVLDIMMPSRDGWEVLQALRSHPATHDVPVIVCSVLRQHDLAISLGANGFLAKPVTQQALVEALESCYGPVR